MYDKPGQPKKFKSAAELENYFFSYIDYCDNNKRMPNIAGFVTYLLRHHNVRICRDTFYNYSNDYPEFFDTIKSIDASLEDSVLNNTSQKDLIKIAYLNNRHKYSEKHTVESTIVSDADAKTVDELKKEISDIQKRLSN